MESWPVWEPLNAKARPSLRQLFSPHFLAPLALRARYVGLGAKRAFSFHAHNK